MPGGMLMRADANGDGIVTREEVMARADARFDRMDANHDGVISPDERPMRRWMRGRSGGDMPPPPRPRPAAADGAAPPPPPPPSGPGGRDRGKPVTRQMERARVAAEFDRADRNHDGRIDQSEIAALRDMQAGPRGPRGDMPPPPPAPPPR
jgi:Ca2+-binding EF-hand superfamily protein